MTVFHSESKKTITGHKALREALRDTQNYSSDLQGDADVRDYRQLPLEVDPPRHHLYRSALAPYFVKPTIEEHVPEFRKNSMRIIENYFSGNPKEVISELALPLVMENLGVIYNRPQDVSEWISWGPDVWTAESDRRDGAVLHRYLDRVYQEALGRSSQDIWSEIAYLEVQGKQITATEFRGIAGVLLAGGRDTVVKLFTGIIWHLGCSSADLEKLRANRELLGSSIQEFLRFLTPLPQMNRTTVPETGATELPEDRYVGMSFISGNFDESVFEKPFEINLERPRNPHLSFGFGPHTCLGNHVAEIEARVFLETLLDSSYSWKNHREEIKFHDAPFDKVPDHFISLQAVKI
ncbi:MAG: cytochrome P450 [Actinobacteria bacterium]|nr:cytochrome P450 [Actinomycetota bacterium]